MYNRKSYTIVDMYAYYIDKYPLGLDYKLFKALLMDYYTILAEQLLSGVEELKMPHRLGTLGIVKYRPKKYNGKSLSVDFKTTRLLGKTIYYLNNHSDGYKYRLFWHKELTNNSSIYHYAVSMVRANKRKLAQIIKQNLNDFPEI